LRVCARTLKKAVSDQLSARAFVTRRRPRGSAPTPLKSTLCSMKSAESRKLFMDLSLGFSEFSQELAIATKPSLEAVVSRFRSVHKEPDSPVRAIHHQTAAEGLFAD